MNLLVRGVPIYGAPSGASSSSEAPAHVKAVCTEVRADWKWQKEPLSVPSNFFLVPHPVITSRSL